MSATLFIAEADLWHGDRTDRAGSSRGLDQVVGQALMIALPMDGNRAGSRARVSPASARDTAASERGPLKRRAAAGMAFSAWKFPGLDLSPSRTVRRRWIRRGVISRRSHSRQHVAHNPSFAVISVYVASSAAQRSATIQASSLEISGRSRNTDTSRCCGASSRGRCDTTDTCGDETR